MERNADIYDEIAKGYMPSEADDAKIKHAQHDSFPPGVADKLKTYAYRLIDPRNGETFYVGKGKGNRVFSHVRGEQDLEGDALDNKIKRIHEIQNAGFKIGHVIHRHGMDDATALAVEAALIDAYPGLTNVAGGTDGSDYGTMHAEEIIRRYSAEEAVFKHKALLISVNRTGDSDKSLYNATRYAWKISKKNADQVQVVLATIRGTIVGAFIASEWLTATPQNFPGLAEGDGVPGRSGFVGNEAPPDIRSLYVGKRVPDRFRKRGAANPIKYTWGKC